MSDLWKAILGGVAGLGLKNGGDRLGLRFRKPRQSQQSRCGFVSLDRRRDAVPGSVSPVG
jgi:hypothetical protein